MKRFAWAILRRLGALLLLIVSFVMVSALLPLPISWMAEFLAGDHGVVLNVIALGPCYFALAFIALSLLLGPFWAVFTGDLLNSPGVKYLNFHRVLFPDSSDKEQKR